MGTHGVIVFLLAAVLIAPLFGITYFNNWGSIESTFIADARFLVEHWPHPLWQPLWYCGTRFDYIYPPALRYGTAAVAIVGHVSTAHAYHLYTAALYCLGIAGVFAFVGTVSRSRLWASIAAAAAAVLSPSFVILRSFREDSALQMPQRLNVLIKWGEGPHVSALSLLPFALLFSWRALSARDPLSSVLAAVACALVVAHNFYGATALAILFAVLAWSIWITHRDRGVIVHSFYIVLLAYGLSAFWLTPSYLRITIDNLKLVAQPGNAWSRCIAVVLAILFAGASWKFARRREGRAYPIFLGGSVLVFLLIVAGHYFFGFRVIGEPHRFVPELDLVLILAAAEALRRTANVRRRWAHVLVAVVVVVVFGAGHQYLLRPWSVFIPDTNFQNRIEFRLSDWISRNLPGARVFATGSLRFWYDAWHNNAQVGGGSEQGLLNRAVPTAQWQVTKDPAIGRDIAWLQALGADAVVVPEPESDALFLEYATPRKFADVLPVAHREQGYVIYKVPQTSPHPVRIVNTVEAKSLRPIPILSNDNTAELTAYAKHLEDGPNRPVEVLWTGTDSLQINAFLNAGESLVIQETYDPAWRAYNNNQQLNIKKDAAGFMRIDASPGAQKVRIVFELPRENTVGRIISAMSMLLAGMVVLRAKTQLKLF